MDAVPGWVWDSREADWENGFTALERFAEREGHTRVAKSHREGDYELGAWVSAQRGRFNRGQLDDARRARLAAQPGWVWHPREAAWEEGFAALESFVEREGHARVPSSHRERDYNLGRWVVVQRAATKNGRLSPERRARLEAQPGWVWDSREADWEDAFAALERFVEREGNAQVLQNHREGDFQLGSWVTRQRTAFRSGTLDPKRQARLEAVSGWTWEARG